MAVWCLCRALDLIEMLPSEHCSRVRQKLGVQDEEIQRWDDISRKMRLVFHDDGILSQFEGYADLQELDWDTYSSKYGPALRLDRILEAEGDTANRYKVSKQADVLMLLYLFSAEELRHLFERLGYPFDPLLIPKTVDYYLKRTANGSTLSKVVSSWVLARSNRSRSWKLFAEALQSDYADVQGGTTPEGIHLGAMAGTVDLIQRCYLGLEARQDVLWLNPQLPAELTRLCLSIRYRQASLCLEATAEILKVRVVHCPIEPIRIGFGDRVMDLKEDEKIELNLVAPTAPMTRPEATLV
jgi:alpha,alpha-trehalase